MKAFYIALPHTESESLWTSLLKYNSNNKLIMAREVSKTAHKDVSGQHFHILADWSSNTYNNFKATIIKNKYNLCGKAEKGGHRKYGLVTKIRDLDKMLSYTIKGNNYTQIGYTDEELQDAYGKSFEKENKKSLLDELMDHLLQIRSSFISPDGDILVKTIKLEMSILEYHIDTQDKPLSKSKLEYYASHYLQCVEPLRKRKEYLEEIFIYLKKK